jgi:hypothetical protein
VTHRFVRRYDSRPALEGAAIAAGLLVAEHVALYRYRGLLPLPARYALGVAALGVGLAHACLERDDLTPLWDAALVALVGGALVSGAHAARWAGYKMREGHPNAIPRTAFVGGA